MADDDDELHLPRLSANVVYTDPDTGKAMPPLQGNWQTAMENLELAFARLAQQVSAVAAAQAAAAAAQESANDAQTAAEAAQAAAEAAGGEAGTVNAETSLRLSYPVGIYIQADDLGSDAGIGMTAHTRRYGNGTEVAVDGGAVVPVAYDVTYFIYYDDPARAGGAVAYGVELVETDALSSAANPARYYVGNVTAPSSGGPPNVGSPANRS